MDEERIEVVAYAGYRGEESPRTLVIDGKRVEVKKVLDRWTEQDQATGEQLRCFKVKGSDFRNRVVCCDAAGTWHCRRS